MQERRANWRLKKGEWSPPERKNAAQHRAASSRESRLVLTQQRSLDRDEESIPFILDGRDFVGSLPRLIRVNPLTSLTGLSSVPEWRG